MQNLGDILMEHEVAALFDLLEKGRHETASFSDEEAAAKRIQRL